MTDYLRFLSNLHPPRDMDVDSKGSITKQEAITALSSGPNLEGTYDSVRTTLKEVQVDSSGQIELEDYIDLIAKLRQGRNKQAGKAVGSPGQSRVVVQGSNSNIQHGILPDELSAFTSHINSVRYLTPFLYDFAVHWDGCPQFDYMR
jgi:plastin-1